MKILILANYDLGLYNFRKELLFRLIEQGHKVYISLPYGEKVTPLVDKGCIFIDTPVDRRGINPLTDFKLFLIYTRLIKKVKPDYVITYTIKPNIYGSLAARLKRVPTISTITGLGSAFQQQSLLKSIISLLYKTALRKTKKVLFENQANLQVFVDNKIIDSKQAFLLPGAGVNLQEFQYTQLNDETKCRFLFMGRIMQEKGVDELFYAAERLKNEYAAVEIDVLGFFEENYKTIVESLSNREIINFYGFQTDVKKYIEKSHCVVLPSYHEGMSNTLLESAAMGRPIITSNINGCKEALIDGETGFLCSVRDEEDLYEKMKHFVQLSQEQKVSMGKSARLHMENNFDREAVVTKVISLLKPL